MPKGTSSYIEFNKLMAKLDQGEVAPVYLFHGEEYYFLEKILDKVEHASVDATTASFNHHVIYGKDANPADVVNLARRFPMMAEKQLVVVKEAQHCKSPESIVPYIENPSPTTVLVWYHPGKKLPMNKKLGMAMKKNAVVFTADAIPDREVTGVVKNYIENKGYDIEPRSLHLLVENSGHRFTTVVHELDKVFSNVESGDKIREGHIEKYVGINKEYNIFALQKALAKKQKESVVEILQFFMTNTHKNPVVLLNASLFSYFKKVAMIQSMSKMTDKEVMSSVGIPFFAMSEYREAARNYPGKKIVDVIGIINECDLKFKGIKQSIKDPRALFEETVLKILSV